MLKYYVWIKVVLVLLTVVLIGLDRLMANYGALDKYVIIIIVIQKCTIEIVMVKNA